MTYVFQQARWFTPGAITEYRALVIHHAEGGGTVKYLSTVARDVSASHVIEYSGRIVQMVKDGDASHCQHVSPEPYTSENFGIYSSLTGRAVLGAEGWADVNRYVFAVEIEGFRAAGPNAAQKLALQALVADLRGRFPSMRGLLGHRDVQDKSCPGALIPWAEIGGHGMFEEAEVTPTTIVVQRWTANGTNGALRTAPDRSLVPSKIPGGTEILSYGEWLAPDGNNWRRAEWPIGSRTEVWFLRSGPNLAKDHDFIAGAMVPVPGAPPIDCTPLVNAARQEGVTAGLRDGARAVKDAAVNAAVLLGG
jgi:hypothetical protein